jgi:hypothetical protein
MRRTLTVTAVIGCASIVGILATATPALAADKGAYRDNFNGRGCDAQVYVSDTTTSGKVEAFGGFSCPSSVQLIGNVTAILYRNGKEVCSKGRHFSLASTSHAECAVTDSSGSQKWKAKLRVATPGTSGSVTITTGEITT